MPVISLRQFGDIGKIAGDAGKSITGVAGQAAGGASQAVEQTKQVTDSVGDVASLAGQVKDLTAATQEAIAFIGMCYEFYLSYKWAFQLLLIFIILIFIMEKMCCVVLWIQFFAKCCCFPVTCGLWLIKHGCCTKIGRCCVSCKELVPDLDEKEKRAADTGLKWNGCDTTYLTTCCGAIKLPDDPERAQAWRLSTMISRVVPCVPASWSDVKKHGDFIGEQAYRELRSRAKSAQGGMRKRMGRDWRKDARLLGAGRYGAKEKQQRTDDGDGSQSEGVVDIDEKGRTKQRSKPSKRRDDMV